MKRIVAALLLVVPGCAQAAPTDTPAAQALLRQFQAAKGGETIKLQAGDYGYLVLPQKRFSRPVTLDAREARFAGLVANDLAGLVVRGGTIQGSGERKTVALDIRRSANVRIEGMQISAAHRGIMVDRSEDIELVGNSLTGLISDGINIALSRRVRVEGNRCRDFNPAPAIFDPNGVRLKDGDHPDCIQAWSRPEVPPVSDIVVIDNDIEGQMQGIFFGNHVRGGVDDGGFDRITIKNNRVVVAHPNGIRLIDGRDSLVTGNQVATVPGAVLPGGKPVKAMLNVSGERTIACGNRVEVLAMAKPGKFPQVEPCRRRD